MRAALLKVDGARYSLRRHRERLVMGLVWRLPRWVVYWATIRAWANATTGPLGGVEAPAVTCADVLKALEDGAGGDKRMRSRWSSL